MKRKRVWIIRFAKNIVETPLWFSAWDDKGLCFTPDFNESMCWRKQGDAEAMRNAIVKAASTEDMRKKMERDLTIEQHELAEALAQ